mgnify:CR=1 FL=1
MLEIIGFIVWVLITLVLSAAPVVTLLLCAIGRTGRTELAFVLICISFACTSWYHIFSSLTITLN